MWYEESVFYQIYPLGFCGAPKENDGKVVNRIKNVIDFIPHIKKTGSNAIYFSPVFSSDRHGYDTRDYSVIDCRLGTNSDFADVCSALHQEGIHIVLDGVFNHVGRGFFAFLDVKEHKWDSKYKDWFHISFDGNSCYDDGFWYEGWEGHFELVKLNLSNPEVVNYLLGCIKGWVNEFDIDGLRLDVAYCLDKNFLRTLRHFCDTELGKRDFFLLGEVLFGDYNQVANDEMCHSVTNYECYKGLHSSFNSLNMFEIAHSLNRQFGPEQWCIYRGKHFLTFVDNHDVSRVASILTDKKHIPLIFTVLFGMPGIPCLYYGSEWGIEGNKSDGDDSLRPYIEKPSWTSLTDYIASLANIRKSSKALCYGSYRHPLLTNKQLIIGRDFEGESVFVGINSENQSFHVNGGLLGCSTVTDLLTGKDIDITNGFDIPEYGSIIYKAIY